MIFITWNVNSITARQSHVEQLLESYEPDIFCMQETKIIDDKFPREMFTQRGYEVEIYGEKSYNGVAIASKEALSGVTRGFKVEIAAGSRRLIAGEIGDLKVLNIYIPNGQAVGSEKYYYKLEWICALKKHIEENYKPSDQLVVCGDFNIAPEDIDVYRPQEWNGAIMASAEERKHLNDIKDWGFIDVFRSHHDEGGLYTWWDYQRGAFRRNAGFRIDHVWATQPLADKCAGVIVAREMRELERPSDHAPVVAEFEL
ncbi:MAG TPA: exodeoxyribonuclease III [Candidatus Obscuribacterales bacterium]